MPLGSSMGHDTSPKRDVSLSRTRGNASYSSSLSSQGAAGDSNRDRNGSVHASRRNDNKHPSPAGENQRRTNRSVTDREAATAGNENHNHTARRKATERKRRWDVAASGAGLDNRSEGVVHEQGADSDRTDGDGNGTASKTDGAEGGGFRIMVITVEELGTLGMKIVENGAPEELLSTIGLSPPANGKRAFCCRVGRVSPGSLSQRHGLREGDWLLQQREEEDSTTAANRRPSQLKLRLAPYDAILKLAREGKRPTTFILARAVPPEEAVGSGGGKGSSPVEQSKLTRTASSDAAEGSPKGLAAFALKAGGPPGRPSPTAKMRAVAKSKAGAVNREAKQPTDSIAAATLKENATGGGRPTKTLTTPEKWKEDRGMMKSERAAGQKESDGPGTPAVADDDGKGGRRGPTERLIREKERSPGERSASQACKEVEGHSPSSDGGGSSTLRPSANGNRTSKHESKRSSSRDDVDNNREATVKGGLGRGSETTSESTGKQKNATRDSSVASGTRSPKDDTRERVAAASADQERTTTRTTTTTTSTRSKEGKGPAGRTGQPAGTATSVATPEQKLQTREKQKQPSYTVATVVLSETDRRGGHKVKARPGAAAAAAATGGRPSSGSGGSNPTRERDEDRSGLDPFRGDRDDSAVRPPPPPPAGSARKESLVVATGKGGTEATRRTNAISSCQPDSAAPGRQEKSGCKEKEKNGLVKEPGRDRRGETTAPYSSRATEVGPLPSIPRKKRNDKSRSDTGCGRNDGRTLYGVRDSEGRGGGGGEKGFVPTAVAAVASDDKAISHPAASAAAASAEGSVPPATAGAIPTRTEQNDSGSNKAKSATTTKKLKRKKPQRPNDMPKRPLSAYNFFFREERERMVADRAQRPTAGREDESDNSDKRSAEFLATVGKAIGQQWKMLSREETMRYEIMAREDRERYNRQMANYRAKASAAKQSAAGDDSAIATERQSPPPPPPVVAGARVDDDDDDRDGPGRNKSSEQSSSKKKPNHSTTPAANTAIGNRTEGGGGGGKRPRIRKKSSASAVDDDDEYVPTNNDDDSSGGGGGGDDDGDWMLDGSWIPRKTWRAVEKVDSKTGRVVATYSSIRVAARETPGTNRSCIMAILEGKRRDHVGFTWRYADKGGNDDDEYEDDDDDEYDDDDEDYEAGHSGDDSELSSVRDIAKATVRHRKRDHRRRRERARGQGESSDDGNSSKDGEDGQFKSPPLTKRRRKRRRSEKSEPERDDGTEKKTGFGELTMDNWRREAMGLRKRKKVAYLDWQIDSNGRLINEGKATSAPRPRQKRMRRQVDMDGSEGEGEQQLRNRGRRRKTAVDQQSVDTENSHAGGDGREIARAAAVAVAVDKPGTENVCRALVGRESVVNRDSGDQGSDSAHEGSEKGGIASVSAAMQLKVWSAAVANVFNGVWKPKGNEIHQQQSTTLTSTSTSTSASASASASTATATSKSTATSTAIQKRATSTPPPQPQPPPPSPPPPSSSKRKKPPPPITDSDASARRTQPSRPAVASSAPEHDLIRNKGTKASAGAAFSGTDNVSKTTADADAAGVQQERQKEHSDRPQQTKRASNSGKDASPTPKKKKKTDIMNSRVHKDSVADTAESQTGKLTGEKKKSLNTSSGNVAPVVSTTATATATGNKTTSATGEKRSVAVVVADKAEKQAASVTEQKSKGTDVTPVNAVPVAAENDRNKNSNTTVPIDEVRNYNLSAENGAKVTGTVRTDGNEGMALGMVAGGGCVRDAKTVKLENNEGTPAMDATAKTSEPRESPTGAADAKKGGNERKTPPILSTSIQETDKGTVMTGSDRGKDPIPMEVVSAPVAGKIDAAAREAAPRTYRENEASFIVQIDRRTGTVVETYTSLRQATRDNVLIEKEGIQEALMGNRNEAGGFIWRYIDDEQSAEGTGASLRTSSNAAGAELTNEDVREQQQPQLAGKAEPQQFSNTGSMTSRSSTIKRSTDLFTVSDAVPVPTGQRHTVAIGGVTSEVKTKPSSTVRQTLTDSLPFQVDQHTSVGTGGTRAENTTKRSSTGRPTPSRSLPLPVSLPVQSNKRPSLGTGGTKSENNTKRSTLRLTSTDSVPVRADQRPTSGTGGTTSDVRLTLENTSPVRADQRQTSGTGGTTSESNNKRGTVRPTATNMLPVRADQRRSSGTGGTTNESNHKHIAVRRTSTDTLSVGEDQRRSSGTGGTTSESKNKHNTVAYQRRTSGTGGTTSAPTDSLPVRVGQRRSSGAGRTTSEGKSIQSAVGSTPTDSLPVRSDQRRTSGTGGMSIEAKGKSNKRGAARHAPTEALTARADQRQTSGAGGKTSESKNKRGSLPVEQVDPASGTVVATYPSVKMACLVNVALQEATIREALDGIQPVVGGFLWRYKGNGKKAEEVRNRTANKANSAEGTHVGRCPAVDPSPAPDAASDGAPKAKPSHVKQQLTHKKTVASSAVSISSDARIEEVEQVDLASGSVIGNYPSLEEALKKNPGIERRLIQEVLNGQRKDAGGYLWRYVRGWSEKRSEEADLHYESKKGGNPFEILSISIDRQGPMGMKIVDADIPFELQKQLGLSQDESSASAAEQCCCVGNVVDGSLAEEFGVKNGDWFLRNQKQTEGQLRPANYDFIRSRARLGKRPLTFIVARKRPRHRRLSSSSGETVEEFRGGDREQEQEQNPAKGRNGPGDGDSDSSSRFCEENNHGDNADIPSEGGDRQAETRKSTVVEARQEQRALPSVRQQAVETQEEMDDLDRKAGPKKEGESENLNNNSDIPPAEAVDENGDPVPFCDLCDGERPVHRSWCPNNDRFNNSGPCEILDRWNKLTAKDLFPSV